MVSLLIEFALFFLVVFVVLPGVMIAWMLAREFARQHPKSTGWHKVEAPKLAN